LIALSRCLTALNLKIASECGNNDDGGGSSSANVDREPSGGGSASGWQRDACIQAVLSAPGGTSSILQVTRSCPHVSSCHTRVCAQVVMPALKISRCLSLVVSDDDIALRAPAHEVDPSPNAHYPSCALLQAEADALCALKALACGCKDYCWRMAADLPLIRCVGVASAATDRECCVLRKNAPFAKDKAAATGCGCVRVGLHA
jgi:hypothetical protein